MLVVKIAYGCWKDVLVFEVGALIYHLRCCNYSCDGSWQATGGLQC
jgi:hypothetical protein